MFIRKRVNHSKRYGNTERYQVLESYREGGKVKQRVICALGLCPTPEKALEAAKEDLRWIEEVQAQPIMPSPWRSGRHLFKARQSREAYFLERREKAEARIAELESVVARYSNACQHSDTTAPSSAVSKCSRRREHSDTTTIYPPAESQRCRSVET